MDFEDNITPDVGFDSGLNKKSGANGFKFVLFNIG